MTPTERREIVAALNRTLAQFLQIRCSECLEFMAADGFCLKWGDQVPDQVRADGCGHGEEDIPF